MPLTYLHLKIAAEAVECRIQDAGGECDHDAEICCCYEKETLRALKAEIAAIDAADQSKG